MSDDYMLPRLLRELALAIEARRDAAAIPGISAPRNITFFHDTPGDMDRFNSNPVLLEAVKREIRISWEELRVRALQRLDSSVEQLGAQVSDTLVVTHPAPAAGLGEGREG